VTQRRLEALDIRHESWLIAQELPQALSFEARDRDAVDCFKQA
jgi:hypothetical protein